jgi:hypothetical protein
VPFAFSPAVWPSVFLPGFTLVARGVARRGILAGARLFARPGSAIFFHPDFSVFPRRHTDHA